MRAAFLFLGLVELPGLVLCLAAGAGALTLIELAVLPTALGLLFAPAVAVALMSVDAFDPWHQALAEALFVIPVALRLARRRRFGAHLAVLRLEWPTRRAELAALGALLALATLAAGRPAEWVLAETMDAGNYVVQAAYQARHASLLFTDAQPDVYAAEFPTAAWRENSASGTPAGSGRRQLPFPPFFRALLALMLWIGGLPLVLHTPLLLGALAGACLYLAVRAQAVEALPALLATALFVGSPLAVQFMRVPMAEMCFVFATLAALAFLSLAARTSTPVAAGLAGAILGVGVLMRLDGLLVYAGAALALSAGLLSRAGHSAARAFASALAVVTSIAWAVAMYATSSYLDHHLHGYAALVSVGLPIMGLLAALVGLSRREPPRRAASGAVRLIVSSVAVAVLVVLFGRPLADAARTLACVVAAISGQPGPGVSHALATLGYMTLPTVLLGVHGLLLIGWQSEAEALLGPALYALGTGVFLYAPFHMPDVFWSSRRNLGHVLPLLALGCAHALGRLLAGRPRAWRAAAALLVLVSLAGHNALITYRNGVQLQGAAASLQALAAHFPERDVVLVDGRAPWAAALQLGLRYLHGREALSPAFDSLREAEIVAYWRRLRAAGRGLHALEDGTAGADAALRRCFELRTSTVALVYRDWVHGRERVIEHAYAAHALVGLRPECLPPKGDATR